MFAYLIQKLDTKSLWILCFFGGLICQIFLYFFLFKYETLKSIPFQSILLVITAISSSIAMFPSILAYIAKKILDFLFLKVLNVNTSNSVHDIKSSLIEGLVLSYIFVYIIFYFKLTTTYSTVDIVFNKMTYIYNYYYGYILIISALIPLLFVKYFFKIKLSIESYFKYKLKV
jgi:hypothetical protein